MSLDKSIQSGKEHRKPFRKAQAVDPTCRCHGTCQYCKNNRLYKNLKNLQKALDKQKEIWYNKYRN